MRAAILSKRTHKKSRGPSSTLRRNVKTMIIQSLRSFFTPLALARVALALLLAPDLGHCETVFESPKESVRLVELFTSEGCNSCPPADAWLSSLRTSDGLWSRYVPVAFHVTYWDSLGWRDRFGLRKFDSLHETTAASANAPVYTPGVFVAGREWRAWRYAPLAIAAPLDSIVGIVKAEVGDASTNVSFDSPKALTQLSVDLAWLQANQTTQVRHGENAGKSLHHEFVARALYSVPMQLRDGVWRASVPTLASDRSAAQAVAIWVVDGAGQPVQATGGWLRSNSDDAAHLP
jgi:hypothetical protein